MSKEETSTRRVCLNGFLGPSSLCIIRDFLGHCASVSEPQRREGPKKVRAAEEGQLCSHPCSKRDGLCPLLPCPWSSWMQCLAPDLPCLAHVHSGCSTQNDVSLSSPEPVPASETLHTHPLFLHTLCVDTHALGTETHTPLSLRLADPLPAGNAASVGIGSQRGTQGQLPRGEFGYKPCITWGEANPSDSAGVNRILYGSHST